MVFTSTKLQNFSSDIYSVGVLGSRAHHLCIYWAPVPIREHEVVRGGVNITRGVRVGK